MFFSVFFFKQKTAYEVRISDWSSDVCSSDLEDQLGGGGAAHADLVDLLPDGKTRHVLFNQKGGDAARSRLGRRLGIDDQRVGAGRVGDPELGAVEDVAALNQIGRAHV